MNAAAIAELRSALPPADFAEAADLDVEGQSIAVVLAPGDPEGLGRVLKQLSQQKLPALVRGGGTRMGVGNLPNPANVLLSTQRLTGVRRYEPDDGVVEASSGTSLAEVRRVVLERGWELPLDAGGATSTVGGAIATAAYGPRCLAFGPVRRNVLGLEIVHASGTLTKCGGRVVKNVTGYDLSKLYTGSFGTLGVISGAWLRLQPRPRAIQVLTAEFSESDRAFSDGLAASRRGTARACLLLSPEVARRVGLEHSLAASWILLVEFAGEESECEHDASWFERECRARRPEHASGDAALVWIDRVREELATPPPGEGARVRIATRPTKLAAAVRPLVKAGARATVDPGLGLVFADFPGVTGEVPASKDERERRGESLVALARSAASASDGSLSFEFLPVAAKRAIDVFDTPVGPQLEIMRRLKREYDPDRLLNPGRFVGGI